MQNSSIDETDKKTSTSAKLSYNITSNLLSNINQENNGSKKHL